MKRFKGCLGVFVVFFLGVIVGVLLASAGIYTKLWELVEGGPDRVAEFLVQRMDDELKLDSLQEREFQRIADRTRLRLRATRHQTEPEVRAILDEATREMRGILSPAQQKKFDKVMKRFREKWQDPEATPVPKPPADSTPASVAIPDQPVPIPGPPAGTPAPAPQGQSIPGLERPETPPAQQD